MDFVKSPCPPGAPPVFLDNYEAFFLNLKKVAEFSFHNVL